MHVRMRTLALATALVAVPAAAGFAVADTAAKTTTTTTTTTSTTPDAKQQMMAEMMKLSMPGPAHAALKAQEGTWNATVTSWDTGPAPATATGSETRRMILGDRFLETHYTGTYAGQPYEGWGLTGFDNKSKEVMVVWADNMNTAAMQLKGGMSADNKTMTCTGSVPGQDGKPMPIRAVTKIDSDTQNTYTMWGTMGGKDVKMMEIVYTRSTPSATAQAK